MVNDIDTSSKTVSVWGSSQIYGSQIFAHLGESLEYRYTIPLNAWYLPARPPRVKKTQ